MYERLNFSELLQFHKSEASEELAYFSIYFAVVLGILSFLGGAKEVRLLARTVIAFFCFFFHFAIQTSLLGSLAIHDAIHAEIRHRASGSINIVDTCELWSRLRFLNEFDGEKWEVALSALGVIWIIGIFTIGNGNLYSFIKDKKKSKKDKLLEIEEVACS